MSKIHWLVPLIVLLSLVGYFFVWPWYRDSGDRASIAALTADMKAAAADIDKAVAEAPETPGKADLERFGQLNQTALELAKRAMTLAPKLQGDAGAEFRAAQDHYSAKIDLMGAKLNEMKKKIDERKTP
jgi:hypothetical protein